MTRLSEPA